MGMQKSVVAFMIESDDPARGQYIITNNFGDVIDCLAKGGVFVREITRDELSDFGISEFPCRVVSDLYWIDSKTGERGGFPAPDVQIWQYYNKETE